MNRKRYAGNFALLVGEDYSKRKSLPRDAHGFEPVEGYFNRRKDDDSVSSDVSSLDEELIQREYERLIMKKKRGWSKKSQKPQSENPTTVPKDDVSRSPAEQSPTRRQIRSILRNSSTRYTETPQQTGLTPASGPRGRVRSKLTWSDARDPVNSGHQGSPAANTRSRQQSARRLHAIRNTDEPVTDRETKVLDKVPSDRENSEPIDHVSDSEGGLSPARQSVAAVSDNFNPVQASTGNSHQTTRRLTRQSMATFQSLANLTVASSESEDEGNSEVIRGLLSNTPRAIVRSSPTKQSLLTEGNSSAPQSKDKTPDVTAASKKRSARSSRRQSSRRTRASKNDEPLSQQPLASEADEPPSPVSHAYEPNSESVPEASETVTSCSHRATRQSTKRSTRDKKQLESEEETIKLSPFQLSVDQPPPFSSSSPRVAETTTVASRRKPPSRTSRVSGFVSQSDDDTSENPVAVKELHTNHHTRASGSVSQSDDDNQETTKISEVASKKPRSGHHSATTSTKRKRKRLNMPLSKKKSTANVSRKSEQSTISRPRKRQVKKHQIEETTTEQSQQHMSPEGNDDMTDQEYGTDQDADTEVTGKEQRRSTVNVSRKSEQSTISRPRKRQVKKHQIEETTTEHSQQHMSPERNNDMTDQEYETDQDATTDQEEEMDVTFIGGKKFQRVEVHQRSDITPGVRRSKRRRIAPIQPGEHLEYQIHSGVTPSKSYGNDLRYVLKPVDSGYHSSKRSRVPQRGTVEEEDDQYMTDPSDDESELRITTSLSNCTPANTLGEVPSASDDVFIYKLFNNEQYSHGYVQMKRFAEKPQCKLGNNHLIGMVVKGRVTVNINGREFTVKPHSWFQVPPGSVYGLVNCQRSSAEIYYTVHRNMSH